ncbi:MAG: hypothetical protein ACXWBO_04295 [Ilumatobacteraceae bacterium]
MTRSVLRRPRRALGVPDGSTVRESTVCTEALHPLHPVALVGDAQLTKASERM